MMVMMMAMTPSLKAARRSLPMMVPARCHESVPQGVADQQCFRGPLSPLVPAKAGTQGHILSLSAVMRGLDPRIHDELQRYKSLQTLRRTIHHGLPGQARQGQMRECHSG